MSNASLLPSIVGIPWEQAEREWNVLSSEWNDLQLTYPDVTFGLLSATVTPDYLDHQVKLTWKYTAPTNQYTAELGDQYGYRVYRQESPLEPYVDVSGFISALDSNSEPITEHVFVHTLTGLKHRYNYQYQIVTENILTPLPPTESQFDSETYPVTLYEHVQPRAITTYQTLNPGLPATDGLIILYPQGLTPVTFEATGQDQQYVVPLGVTSIRADVWGAGGGGHGGGGGYTTGTINVTPGETLGIGVGEKGVRGPSSTIGYSPGGRAGRSPHTRAYHGGGLSGIFRGTISRSNSILIAGGGGGASGNVRMQDGGGGGGGVRGGSGSGSPIYWQRTPAGGPTQLFSPATRPDRSSNDRPYFVGDDGQLYGQSTGGGGGAGYWSGFGGQADTGEDGSGGGGSGYIAPDVISGSTYTGPTGKRGGTVTTTYTVQGYTTQEFLPGYLVSLRETQNASTNSVPMSSETIRVMVGTEYPHPMLRSYYGIDNATLITHTDELDFETEVLDPDGNPRITGVPYPEHVGTGKTYMQVVVGASDDISTFDTLHLSGGHDPDLNPGGVPTTLIDAVHVGDLSMNTSVGSGEVVSLPELIADIDTNLIGFIEVGDVTMKVTDEHINSSTMQHVLTTAPHVESVGTVADETEISNVFLAAHCLGHTNAVWEQVNTNWDQLPVDWQRVGIPSGQSTQQITSDMPSDIMKIGKPLIYNYVMSLSGLTITGLQLSTGEGDFEIWSEGEIRRTVDLEDTIESSFPVDDPSITSLNENGDTLAIAYPHSQVLRVFDLNGSNEWVQRGTDMTIQSNNSSGVGSPGAWTKQLSISADGNRVGVTMSSSVALTFPVQVFEWSNNSWNQLGSNLPISTNYTPTSIQLDDDGSTLIVGMRAYGSTSRASKAMVFTYDGSNWNQKGSSLPQGVVASINSDGSVVATISFGTYAVNNTVAEVHEWNESNSSWDQKGSTISAGSGGSSFPEIGLSSNGNVVYINNPNYNGIKLRVYYWDGTGSVWKMKGSTLGSTYLNVTMDRDGQTLAGGIFIATGNNTGGTNGARAKVEIYTWNQTSNSWDLVDVIEETESPYSWKWNVNLSKNGEVLTLGGTASTDVDVYQFTQYTSEPT